MNRSYTVIIAGIIMAISFFLPWISGGFMKISPSLLLEMGSDAFTLPSVLFVISFILAGAVAVLTFTGKAKPAMVAAAGVYPFVLALIAFLRISAETQNMGGGQFGMGDLGMFFDVAAFGLGLYAYVVSAIVLIVVGVMEMRDPKGLGVSKTAPTV